MSAPQVAEVYAEAHADGSVMIWREKEKWTRLVFYPAGCPDIPSRKYTLFIKLPGSARWAVKWIN